MSAGRRWIFGCCSVELRWRWRSVALWAGWNPQVACWILGEGGGRAELVGRRFWKEVEKLKVFR